ERAGLPPVARLAGARGEFAQQRDLALGDHALGRVVVDTYDPADRAVLDRDRAVGEGVVGLLGVAVALHDQELLFGVGPLVPGHRRGEQRTDLRPDLAPHFGGRPAKRARMLAAD